MSMTDRSADKQKKHQKKTNKKTNKKLKMIGGGGQLPPPGVAPVHNYNTDVSGVANLRIPITRISWKFGKS